MANNSYIRCQRSNMLIDWQILHKIWLVHWIHPHLLCLSVFVPQLVCTLFRFSLTNVYLWCLLSNQLIIPELCQNKDWSQSLKLKGKHKVLLVKMTCKKPKLFQISKQILVLTECKIILFRSLQVSFIGGFVCRSLCLLVFQETFSVIWNVSKIG